MRSLKQTGDTIVEVLIALTVVASMLGGAYVTSSRSLNNNRQAQERGEALKIAEAQMERLKAVVSASSTAPFTVAYPFCIRDNNILHEAKDAGGRPTSACTISTAGPAYTIAMERTNTDLFTTTILWDRVGGNGQDQITMNYRIQQQDSFLSVTDPVSAPTPPPPPVDVCPNIAGLQVSLPAGLILSGGNCVAPPPVNVALGKSVTGDMTCPYWSPQYVTGPPGNLTDGNPATMWYPGNWCSHATVDLGSVHNLNSIRAGWYYFGFNYGSGLTYITSYTIETSPNGSSWNTVGSGGIPNTNVTTVNGTFNNVRYIRVRANSYGNWIGFYEIEAYRP